MSLRIRLLSLVALVVALAAFACGNSAPFAARVDGHSISQDALEDELRSIAANERYLEAVEEQLTVRGLGQGTFDAAFTAQVLSRQIVYALVSGDLDRRGVVVTEADLAAARPGVVERVGGDDILDAFSASYQADLIRRTAELDVLTVALLGAGSPTEAARARFESNPESFTTACVRHILVETADRAAAVKARLDAGEGFATVAQDESADTLTAAEGGALGCGITRDTGFVPEFLNAVFTQEVGVVGSPVESSFGFHVIEVTSRAIPAYEEVAAVALAELVASGQSQLRTWLENAVEGADISVNPKYGTFQKAGANSRVVPPQTSPGARSAATVLPPFGAPG